MVKTVCYEFFEMHIFKWPRSRVAERLPKLAAIGDIDNNHSFGLRSPSFLNDRTLYRVSVSALLSRLRARLMLDAMVATTRIERVHTILSI